MKTFKKLNEINPNILSIVDSLNLAFKSGGLAK